VRTHLPAAERGDGPGSPHTSTPGSSGHRPTALTPTFCTPLFFCRLPLCRLPLCRLPLCRLPLCRLPLCRLPLCRLSFCRLRCDEPLRASSAPAYQLRRREQTLAKNAARGPICRARLPRRHILSALR
jgi:hypothetical protein